MTGETRDYGEDVCFGYSLLFALGIVKSLKRDTESVKHINAQMTDVMHYPSIFFCLQHIFVCYLIVQFKIIPSFEALPCSVLRTPGVLL